MLKKNFLYNLLLTVSGYLFTFISFPYVTRILGVDNIGIVNFVDGIVNYFIIISTLGVTTVGIREVAKNKIDKKKLQKVFAAVFGFHAICSIVAVIILLLSTFFVPKFYENKDLMLIGCLKILANLFLVEWFFSGIENFKLIALRSLAIKFISVLLIFLFVREKDDFMIYYIITVLTTVFNVLVNWNFLVRNYHLKLRASFVTTYARPIFTMGAYVVATSLYTTFNIVFLGFVSGTREVGYYSTALKLFSILLAIFTAFSNVMLPRMTSLIKEQKNAEFQRYINKSFQLLMFFSLPIILLVVFNANLIITKIFGNNFSGSIVPLQIMMPLWIIIGLEQILILQILMPLNRDKTILKNAFVGASVGLLLNILIVKQYESIGTAIVWLCSEFTVLILAGNSIIRNKLVKIPFTSIFINLLVSIPAIGGLFWLNGVDYDEKEKCIISVFLIVTYFIGTDIFVLKNKNILLITKSVFAK